MLPDFPKTKEKLGKMIKSEMKKACFRYMGPIADSPKSMMFEGNKSIIVREDGSVSEMNPQEMTTKIEIKVEELEGMDHEMVMKKINSMGKEMAEKQAKLAYDVMIKTAEKVGNKTSYDGIPFSIDILLEALEKMHIEFDAEGQPSGLTLVANPNTPIDKVVSQAADDPRYQELMERKRKEWHVRESRRKLVG